MEAPDFERYLEAWNDHDIDRILEFFTDDCVYEDLAVGRINKGKEELRKFAQETFETFPDFRVVDERGVSISSDGRYFSEWTLSGTHEGDRPGFPATHKSFSVRGATVGEIREGKITRNSDYWNLYDSLVQLGMAPPLPS